MKHVIIGNSAAAVGAVEGIRKRDSKASVTIISDEPHHTYSRPLISYFLSGKVNEQKMAYRPQDFYKQHGVETMLGKKATGIDTVNRTVYLESGEKISYDNLLVATGSKPAVPDVTGIDKENVFSFYTLDDSRKLQSKIRPGMRGVVLGAGLTALKAAEALTESGIETTLVVRSRILRNFLDSGAGELLAEHLQKNGLNMVTGSEPLEICGSTTAEVVTLKNGHSLTSDFIISAVGITPNTDVVAGTEIQTGHGILIDKGMRTSAPGVYAAGDVAEGYDLLSGQRRVIPLLPVAYGQGETAGRNMAGDDAAYLGINMNAVSFFGLPVISAGVIQEDSGDLVQLQSNPENSFYRKLVFRGNLLVGFVLVNEVDRAGILTWLIREKVDITGFIDSLQAGTFNYAHLPESVRKKKLA